MNYKIISNFLEKQKIKAVEKYDFEKGFISYSNKINQHREINVITGKEEIVRAYLISKLVNQLGYNMNTIEIEKEYDIGRPKINKNRIDIIVRDSKGNAFLYIEVKSPNEYEKNKDEIIEKQLFNMAACEKGQGINVKYLVLYSFDIVNDEIVDKSIIIDYEKFPTFEEWKKIRNSADTLPNKYGIAQKEPYIKGSKKC